MRVFITTRNLSSVFFQVNLNNRKEDDEGTSKDLSILIRFPNTLAVKIL